MAKGECLALVNPLQHGVHFLFDSVSFVELEVGIYKFCAGEKGVIWYW